VGHAARLLGSFLLAAGVASSAPALRAGGETLPSGLKDAEIRELNQRILAARNVMFDQQTERYFRNGSRLRSDSFTATVRFVDGTEEYRSIRRGDRSYSSLKELGGPFVMGELTTVLSVTRDALARGNALRSDSAEISDEPAIATHFHVGGREMGWLLVVGSSTWSLDFDGTAVFSVKDGSLLEISWRSSEPDLPGYCGIQALSWTTYFSSSPIGGTATVVPMRSTYRVEYTAAAHRTEWTESRFLNYRRFGATSELTFANDSTDR